MAHTFCITFQQKFISTKVKHCIRLSDPTVLQDSKPNGAFHSCHINVIGMKEVQLRLNVFTSSEYGNLL
jgi:hypothetical protein